ncbi:MAG: 50S ribosomal protein L10 [Candidatus Saganbacteria bacterium]|nr:50S ribosomal protein L10 [Candidatus Saganbacteria bacterium]
MSQRAIAEKSQVVAGLKEKIARASVLVVADYLGCSVKELTALRRKLRAENSELCVAKNTLIGRAVSESGYSELTGQLKGPTALLLGYQDAVAPLKVLATFVKEAEKGALRVGVVDKKVFQEGDLKAIAKLPSRTVLLGRVVGGLQAPISGFVNVLQGPVRKLVYALDAIKAKKGGE